jgi:osmotically inducible protein OsmC
MATTSAATTTWQGTLIEGAGRVSFDSSGVGTFDVSWASRSEAHNGKTSPEELLAAAHTSCFSMALSSALAKGGTPAEQLVTTAQVDFVPGTGITEIRLHLVATVPGLDHDGVVAAAEGAKVNCPVSKALAAVPITLVVETA